MEKFGRISEHPFRGILGVNSGETGGSILKGNLGRIFGRNPGAAFTDFLRGILVSSKDFSVSIVMNFHTEYALKYK